MIVNALLSLLKHILDFVLGLFPTISVPDWLSSSDGAMATVFADAGSMSVWFPVTLAVTIVGSVLLIWFTGWGIKIARMVLSLFTGGGGNA